MYFIPIQGILRLTVWSSLGSTEVIHRFEPAICSRSVFLTSRVLGSPRGPNGCREQGREEGKETLLDLLAMFSISKRNIPGKAITMFRHVSMVRSQSPVTWGNRKNAAYQWGLLHALLVSFPVAVIKYSDKSNFGARGFMWPTIQGCSPFGETRWLRLQAVSYIPSTVKSKE